MFLAAGIYNLTWGLFSAAKPQWLFTFSGMPPANYPQIFACLGMVIGLYGVLYLEVAEAGARMVAGGGGARGKSAWSDWTAAINLDRAMAQVDYPPVDHK